MASIIWTEKALGDFEHLIEYIAKDAPLAARRFAQKMMKRIELLREHPELGGAVTEDTSRVYREILQGSYRIIYRSEKNVIYLIAIHHSARLLDIGKVE